MDDHRAERCVGASKRIKEARIAASERLTILGRDASHIAVPEEAAEEASVPNPRKRHLASEEARRADQCCSFIKRFKEAHPDILAIIGVEHQLIIA
ncbi:unnamed protein product [Anisakis simplex]|uniref:Transposase n=1 Tax=Anisakis simplex TaxID=6269 RepID=A0A0M3K524_ANISI|nr:unnamed protein product [Anisakis simplex]